MRRNFIDLWRAEGSSADFGAATMVIDQARNFVQPTRQPYTSFATPVRRIVKRLFDICVALAMLLAFAPLFALIAVLIRAADGGPVFYAQQRVGRDRRMFGCLKFRTMVTDADAVLKDVLASDPAARAEWEEKHKLSNDPRIIPGIGHLLRKSSLDEVPQLFNILFGDMSVVGPRPVTEDELVNYGVFLSHYLAVKPGLTGPWQIGGRSDTSYKQRVQMDVEYVERGSLRTDLSIFVQTVSSFVRGRLTGAA